MHVIDCVREYVGALRISGNLRTARTLYRPNAGRQQLTIRLRGQLLRVHVRGESSDVDLVKAVLHEQSEYRLPVQVEPEVIFDIGANIGITALYFAAVYPNARIYCFEPLPDNLDLLRANVAAFADRITVVPKGVGDREQYLPYRYSDDPLNFGGGGFYGVGCDEALTIRLPVTTIGHACAELGVKKIDVLKIDTEGAEMAVLQGIPESLIRQVSVVVGELHGIDDFSFLQQLSITHAVGCRKSVSARCFPFEAVKHG